MLHSLDYPGHHGIFYSMKEITISNSIKDSAKNMVKFYFESNFPNDFELNVIKNNLLAHIDKSKISATIEPNELMIKIEQKSGRFNQNVSRN